MFARLVAALGLACGLLLLSSEPAAAHCHGTGINYGQGATAASHVQGDLLSAEAESQQPPAKGLGPCARASALGTAALWGAGVAAAGAYVTVGSFMLNRFERLRLRRLEERRQRRLGRRQNKGSQSERKGEPTAKRPRPEARSLRDWRRQIRDRLRERWLKARKEGALARERMTREFPERWNRGWEQGDVADQPKTGDVASELPGGLSDAGGTSLGWLVWLVVFLRELFKGLIR